MIDTRYNRAEIPDIFDSICQWKRGVLLFPYPFRLQLCGLKDEGLPDIMFMMRDDVAVKVYNQMSGHG